MLRITSGRGFQLVFANGWTVSIQFGPGNYCENRDMAFSDGPEGYRDANRDAGEKGCATAEIAAWPDHDDYNASQRKAGELVSFGDDAVKGWCNADEVAAFIALVVSLPAGDCADFAQRYNEATQHIQR